MLFYLLNSSSLSIEIQIRCRNSDTLSNFALNKGNNRTLNIWQHLSRVTFIYYWVMDIQLRRKSCGLDTPAATDCAAGLLLVKLRQNQPESKDWEIFLCYGKLNCTLLKLTYYIKNYKNYYYNHVMEFGLIQAWVLYS